QLESIAELETDNSFLRTLDEYLDELRKETNQEYFEVSNKVEDLMYGIKGIISVPFNSITKLYPKVVRDLAKDQAKKIDIEITGDNLEIDRRILEEIRDPLIHILRNCVDHGIETPEVRKSKNKPAEGTIRLSIERLENNAIEIVFLDDGAGLNFAALRKKYLKDNAITSEKKDAMTNDDLIRYIFQSGISTADMITDISGRGLGMAIVKEKITQLGGSIKISSEKDKGTELKIRLPLSLVNFTGILVQVSEAKFVIPTARIQTILRINRKDIKTLKNKDTIVYKETVHKLCHLADLLQITRTDEESKTIAVIIFSVNQQNIGFAVDRIIGEDVYQTKKFNQHLDHIKNFSGATILGSGEVVPILNVYDLIQASQEEVRVKKVIQKVRNEIRKKILIVEDSITSRMLLKNILESTGYEVQTAVDGMEGYSKLKEFDFDMILSDIDMPRMNGFEMTSKIRAESKYEELPIILVTSLSRREDKERGMEVGANAYIVKSSFDQNNLLETIKKLL
nr:response regulator [Candidatus Cloacimonadota bacterium]